MKYPHLRRWGGLEIGCGKGRNAMWLAQQGVRMSGFDFSDTAIRVAKSRSEHNQTSNKTHFIKHDAIEKWPYEDGSFDFVLDCFATVDIESNVQFIFNEIVRVLKPNGYLFVYTNSDKSQIYQESKTNTKVFRYPNIDKFERVYSHDELRSYTRGLKEIAFDSYDRYSNINEQAYKWNHYWVIYQQS